MKNRLLILVLVLFVASFSLKAQTGGKFVYEFLNLNYSSRVLGLGGNLISVYDDDFSVSFNNPSYISDRFHNNLTLNYTNYFAKSNAIAASYSYTFPKAGSFSFGVFGLTYGSFKGTDAAGIETGKFSAGDYALVAGWGRELTPNISVGANLKTIFSHYDSYYSIGIAADLAGSYHNEENNISLTLLAKNIGSQIRSYTSRNYELAPFDLQFAFSQRLQHVPIRYHISLHSLYRWNMNYYGVDNPFQQTDAISGQLQYPSKVAQFADNLFRHFVFGVEIEPSKYFSLQVAYNHNVHQDMKLLARKSMAGFSYGLQLNIKGIRVGFSRMHYAAGISPNCFDFAFDFEELSKNHNDKKAKKLKRIDG